jgi:hypothetical protein
MTTSLLQRVSEFASFGEAMISALQNNDKDIRISNFATAGNTWLVVEGVERKEFVVYQKKYRAKRPTQLTRTSDCREALQILLDA